MLFPGVEFFLPYFYPSLDTVADYLPADAIIWVGRRLGYLWRYQDAIQMFSRGIAAHPNDPRMYRHRGHRLIKVRRLPEVYVLRGDGVYELRRPQVTLQRQIQSFQVQRLLG